MSDFIKTIVAEVLQRGSDSKPAKETNLNLTKGLANINRPNYQQLNKEQRLAKLKSMNSTPSASITSQKEPRLKKNSFSHHNLIENPMERFPALAKITMSPLRSEQSLSSTSKHAHKLTKQRVESMGTTKDAVRAWLFPEPIDLVAKHMKSSWRNRALGIIWAKHSYPSQLFLIDNILKDVPEDAYQLEWSPLVNEPFTLELALPDEGRLHNLITKLYQALNRRGLKQLESYVTTHPSAWLTKQLKLTHSVQALGILESLVYYDNLYLLARYVESNSRPAIECQVEKHYLLLAGEETSVKQALDSMKKEASYRLAVR